MKTDNKRIVADKVFGVMEYKYSWTKKDSFMFLNKAYIININAQAYKDEKILDTQRNNYKNFNTVLTKNKTEVENKLKEYCEEFYNAKGSIRDYLIPKTVIFLRDNSWGILFETQYDVEQGIAIFFKDKTIEVGTQDQFL